MFYVVQVLENTPFTFRGWHTFLGIFSLYRKISAVQDFCSPQIVLGSTGRKTGVIAGAWKPLVFPKTLPLLEADYHFCIGFSVQNQIASRGGGRVKSLLSTRCFLSSRKVGCIGCWFCASCFRQVWSHIWGGDCVRFVWQHREGMVHEGLVSTPHAVGPRGKGKKKGDGTFVAPPDLTFSASSKSPSTTQKDPGEIGSTS